MRVFHNFIEGRFVLPRTRSFIRDVNPADTREVLGRTVCSLASDVNLAVASASKAFPVWKAMPAPRRAEILFRAAGILSRDKERLARLMTREMGKPLRETRGEVQEAVDTAFYYAGEGRRLIGETTPSELKDKFCFTLREPLGVCGLITPWNFPMAIPAWKIFPALIAGNTVVLKPSEETPATSVELAQVFHEAGLPPGVLNIVQGNGPQTGQALVRHPGVRLMSFTGSSGTGRKISIACASHFKKHSLEMGGKNAIVVMSDADLELAVNGVLWGAFSTSGQRCTASSRVILHRKIAGKFTENLIHKVKELTIGNGLDPQTDVGPIINARQVARILRYIAIGKKEKSRILIGGKRLNGVLRHGYFIAPTVFSDVSPHQRIAQEEIFGPVTCLMKVRDLNEAMRVANHTVYGLSAGFYSRKLSACMKAVNQLETGIVYVNGPTIGAESHLAFGGVKSTGNGFREAGRQALDIFTEWKTVYMDYSGHLQKAQME